MKVDGLAIREASEIKWGAVEEASTFNIIREYLLYSQFANAKDFRTGDDNIFYDMLDALVETWNEIEGGTVNFAATTLTNSQCFMNLGKLARKILTGPTLETSIDTFSGWMLRKADGTAIADTNSEYPKFKRFWAAIGSNLKEYIGEWNTTYYRTEDDALAGWFIVLQVLCMWLDLHFASVATLIRDFGEYVREGSIVRGTYRQFNRYLEPTWGAAILEEENGVDSFMELYPNIVDDNVLRGIDLPVVEGWTKLMKLFTRSKWVWRFGRYVEVIPLWFIHTAKTGLVANGLLWDTFDDLLPFLDNANVTMTSAINLLNHLISRMQAFYFKNKSFVKFKTMYKTLKFFDFPVLGTGTGGLLCHQMTGWEVQEEPSTDNLFNKSHYGSDAKAEYKLQMRRGTDHNNVFQIIGDVPLEDYLLWVGLSVTQVKTGSGFSSCYPWITPIGGFAFGIYKNEDEPYQLDPDEMFELAGDVDMVSLACGLKAWGQSANWPLNGIDQNKTAYYANRTLDPYKKLTHKVYDTNNLDVENLRNIVSSCFWGVGSAELSGGQEIPVSGVVEGGFAGTHGTDASDPTGIEKKTEIKDTEPAISAVVDKKKEEKKEDKK